MGSERPTVAPLVVFLLYCIASGVSLNNNQISDDCVREENIDYSGNNLGHIRNYIKVDSVHQCAKWCGITGRCKYWTFLKSNGVCRLKHSNAAKRTNSDATSGTKGCGKEPGLNGYCLTSGGQDQNDGTKRLNSGGKSDCYRQCKAVPQASGCEWYKDGGCIYHTLDVATANGHRDFRCWIFNSSLREPELNGYCLTSGGQDQNDGTKWLNSGDKSECYRQCKAVPQASGCEWYKDGGCIYHTLDVATGNGNKDFRCWIFNSSLRACKSDEKISGSACMCQGTSCEIGGICKDGNTCTPACQADVESQTDCLCGDANCAAGSTCVGGSTCTTAEVLEQQEEPVESGCQCVQEVNGTIENLQKKTVELENENNIFKDTIDNLQKKTVELENQNNNFQDTTDNMQKKTIELENQNNIFQDTTDNLQKKIVRLEKNFQDQLTTLQDRLAKLQILAYSREVCFEDLDSPKCEGSQSGHVGIVEAIRVDGGWGPWQEWSQCSSTCSGGSRVRHRTCKNPQSQHGGKSCIGPAEDRRKCNEEECIVEAIRVDGRWGPWQEWSQCSSTCGEGSRVRHRSCNNPQSQHGGKSCIGPAEDRRNCNEGGCAPY